MYCVIQEIETKKANPFGGLKKLEAYQTIWSDGNNEYKKWCYRYTGGRFQRPIKKAYKISIHKSYREHGRVKKKQWPLCSIGYYDVLVFDIYEHIRTDRVEEIIKDLEISEEEFWDIVYEKYNPLRERIEKEFQQTEEFKVKEEHDRITTIYAASKADFEGKYGRDTYDYCYDVFGVLRNVEYLKKLQDEYEANQRFYEKYRSYSNSSQGNYSDNDYSSYFKSKDSTYTDKEKEYLKVMYKAAALKLHPDIKKDNGEGMKFLNKLKDQWGI
ncbi:hypothetical protein IAI10_02605 [Clostridium sp. 19966]|uniref:hypothetical protein n=1 Tax=Clostridium sp. 19966 TaxID=2768166 RepID=UPI0028E00A6D|nr:hypothetical protein [Clostridium sp. 19966]MDT8715550.1 hypothetical protein [Clostridium sp. 19966]